MKFSVDEIDVFRSFEEVCPNEDNKVLNNQQFILAGEAVFKIDMAYTSNQFIDAIRGNEKEESHSLTIPSTYLTIFQHHWYYADRTLKHFYLAPCLIHISYEDITGELIEQQFQLIIKMESGIGHLSEGTVEMVFKSEVKEIVKESRAGR